MKNYLDIYLKLYGKGSDQPIFEDDDFENVDKLLQVLPDKLQALGSDESNYYRNLPGFIQGLADRDLKEFIEDILYEDEECIETIFESSKYATAAQNAFDSLINLPHNTLEKIEKCFESIFQRVFRSGDIKDTDVVKKIMDITARNKVGLSKEFLMRKFDTPGLSPLFKLNMLTLLAAMDLEKKPALKEFWQKIDLSQEPWLVPAVMAAFKYNHPTAALEVLKKVPSAYVFIDTNIRSRLKRNIETTLCQIRIQYKREIAIRTFRQVIPAIEASADLTHIFRDVLKQDVELDNIEDIFRPFREIMAEYLPESAKLPIGDAPIESLGSAKTDADSEVVDRQKHMHSVVFELRNATIKVANKLLRKLKLSEAEKDEFIRRLDEEAQHERVSEEILQYVAQKLDIPLDKWFNQESPKYEGSIEQIFDRFESESHK